MPEGGPTRSPDAVWRALQAGTAFVVLGLFLWSLGGVLSPFVLFWVLLAALLPFRGRPGHSALVTLASVLILLWILNTTGFLLAPFVLGLVLAYVLDPLVDRLERLGVGRTLAIFLLILPVGGVAVMGVVFGIPALAQQIHELIEASPLLVSRLTNAAVALQDWLRVLPGIDGDALVARIQEIQPDAVVAYLQERRAEIAQGTWQGVIGVGRGLASVVTVLGYIVLTPVLAFYLLRDYDGILARVNELLPRHRRAGIVAFAGDYDRLLSKYLRGQLTVALILGVIMAAGLLIVRFPYALLIGALVGVLSLVPYLGLAISMVPALVIALVSGSVVMSLIKLASVYAVTQMLEGTVISPRIVGESVGLHPVWVVLSLSMGGFFLGFAGFLIAVPLAVGVKLLVVRGVASYKDSELYRGSTD